MKLTGENRSTRGKTCPSAALSTTNPTWTDWGSNPGLRGGMLAANCLSHGTAIGPGYICESGCPEQKAKCYYFAWVRRRWRGKEKRELLAGSCCGTLVREQSCKVFGNWVYLCVHLRHRAWSDAPLFGLWRSKPDQIDQKLVGYKHHMLIIQYIIIIEAIFEAKFFLTVFYPEPKSHKRWFW
jgi:hypothetical protein